MSKNTPDSGFMKQTLKAARNAAFAVASAVTPQSVAIGTATTAALVLDTACSGGGDNNNAPQPVNHAPVLTAAVFDNGGVPFNSAKSINLTTTLKATDQDHDAISFRINRVISGDTNATASIAGTSLTIVPAVDVEGSQVLEIVGIDPSGAISVPVTLTINGIDTKAPVVTDPTPDTTSLTNHDVTVTVASAETDNLTSTSTGWTRFGVAGNWSWTKTYTSNITNDPFVVTDTAGNVTTKLITISNIDKTGPVVDDAIYSTTAPTNQPVTVTFETLENLDAPTGWTKGTDATSGKYTYTESFSSNITETVVFFDKANNETDKVVNIANIDTTPPAVVTFDADASSSTLNIKVTIDENGKGYVWFPGMVL
jgi:tRNA(Arg) A34 adenosine deaminase TadA